jgi:hypothetical protein
VVLSPTVRQEMVLREVGTAAQQARMPQEPRTTRGVLRQDHYPESPPYQGHRFENQGRLQKPSSAHSHAHAIGQLAAGVVPHYEQWQSDEEDRQNIKRRSGSYEHQGTVMKDLIGMTA